jgi:hypothetical protein
MRFLVALLLGSAILLQSGCKDEKDILAEIQKEVAQKAALKEAENIAVATRSAQLEELKFRETLRKERLVQIEATKKLIAELEAQPKPEGVQTNREILQEIGLWDGSEAHWMALFLARDNTMERLNITAEKYRRDKSAERRKALEERAQELELARSRLVQLLSLADNEPRTGNAGKGK